MLDHMPTVDEVEGPGFPHGRRVEFRRIDAESGPQLPWAPRGVATDCLDPAGPQLRQRLDHLALAATDLQHPRVGPTQHAEKTPPHLGKMLHEVSRSGLVILVLAVIDHQGRVKPAIESEA